MNKLAAIFLLLFFFSCSNDAPKKRVEPAAPVPVAQTVTAKNPLTLMAGNVEGNAGAEVCADVTVANFVNLLSFQYSIKWDPAILKFTQVRNFGLPHYNVNSFGAHKTEEGVLTTLWLDNDLRGISRPDGSSIFQICFNAIGQAGQSSYLRFAPDPTPFEAVDLGENVLEINGVEGSVKIK